MKRFLAGFLCGITLATSLSLVSTAWTQSSSQRVQDPQRIRSQQLRIEMENQLRDTRQRLQEGSNRNPC